jgi:two-component system, chemotaxis family, CheB/CheR fusion protein
VTERHESQQRVAEHVATLEAVFGNSVFGVLVLDAEDRVLRANDVFARMSGYDPATIVGMPARLVTHEADPLELVDGAAADGGTTVGIAHRRLIARDGTPYFVATETRTLPPDGDARRIIIVNDVTRLHEANTELSQRARFDAQTGLLARSHFRARLAAELDRAARDAATVAVLWIDLDGFKQVNDRYGHQAGDAALREVAGRLQQLIRRHDAVGRLGGDEFAILVTDLGHAEDLEPVTQRVLDTLREPVHLHDTQVCLSGSVGVAMSPADGTDPDTLLHSADTAMYSAKEGGSDRRVYFRAAMNEAAEHRAGLRHDLAEALRKRRFVLHYQPVVDIATRAVRSVEALIRWERDGAVVPAADFMAVAEQTGQLQAIGAISLDLLDEDLPVLRGELGDGALTVCVNLSPAQLEEREMLDRLLAWGPPGGFEGIVIEVTEAAALARGGRAVETLALLSRLGVRLSIDDFGTGYSNLALLDRLRPSLIKIDRTLLVGAIDQPRGEAVLRAAVQLAHALEAEVVLEGVENERLWTLAQSLPAEQAQGFHLGRPMPLADLANWVRSRR